MKHLFNWLWHGENVGARLAVAITAMAGVVIALPAGTLVWGTPPTVEIVAGLVIAGLSGVVSRKNVKAIKK